MHQGQPPDPGSQVICKQRIEVVGNQQAGFVKKKEEEKPDVVFCIETGSFVEQEPHPFHPIWSRFQRKALFSPPSDKQHIESHLHQRIANPVHALVGGKVVGYGDDYTFQGL